MKTTSRYAMLVDLDKCDGCGACMVACAMENNVPPPSSHAKPRTGRNWLRVFRIQTEQGDVHIPVACMQCEDETPCQSVCPQKAVEFDPATGIVGQIPERCLGCRYCMAACPYQARVFNWDDPQWPAGYEATLNPAVGVRQRGTVEKCNFCHGRWHQAREQAAAEGKPAGAVAYTPACAEACPSQAVTFGDLNDPVFAARTREADAFRLLEPLGTGPKVFYRTSSVITRKAVTEQSHA
jgi:molybdopterin-containing oxidoreductase family iron-sulfur binding subunit